MFLVLQQTSVVGEKKVLTDKDGEVWTWLSKTDLSVANQLNKENVCELVAGSQGGNKAPLEKHIQIPRGFRYKLGM